MKNTKRYVQPLSKHSEWLSKMKKRISLCLCALWLMTVQNEAGQCPKWRVMLIAIKLSRYELISTPNIQPVKDWIKPWNTVVTEHNPPVILVSVLWLQAVTLGYWIFLVGYWIFCSKFLNLIAMGPTLPRNPGQNMYLPFFVKFRVFRG